MNSCSFSRHLRLATYAHLDYVGIHEQTLESSREGLLCNIRREPPQVEEEGRAVQSGYTWMVATFCLPEAAVSHSTCTPRSFSPSTCLVATYYGGRRQ